MEYNTRKTLPERSQRDYWEFNTKNKNKNKNKNSTVNIPVHLLNASAENAGLFQSVGPGYEGNLRGRSLSTLKNVNNSNKSTNEEIRKFFRS